MKAIIYLSIGLLIICNQLIAQHTTMPRNKDVEGIYINLSDLKNENLTCQVNSENSNARIKLKQFFISPDIVCNEHGMKNTFLKDSIFAIHLFNGESYRFINRTPCFIADTSYLYIYELKTVKTEHKTSGPHHRTKEIPVICYYFSFGDHKAIHALTLSNLSKFVVTDPSSISLLNSMFMTNAMLSEINQQTGRFKINEFLSIP